jgi:hypothetical protein
MIRRRTAVIAGGVISYSALALALLASTPVIERVGAPLPGPLLAIVVSALGPVAVFADGIGAWPIVAVTFVLISSCLGLARLTWQKFPETEWFAFWLMCAVLVWAGSPWLLIVVGI